MPAYTSITVIYNPHSTGSGKELARELKKQLGKTKLPQPVKLMPTKHAGHGETLAYQIAKASKRPLIISASGDGGYHEVVNGLMRAQQEGAHPVAGLLPAGNANDHFHNLHQDDIAHAIQQGAEQRIDLLKITATSHGKPLQRYAHSYIGLGLTPKAGQQLNKHELNRLNEIWIVLRVLFRLKPVRLLVKGRTRAYDSLIFSNVRAMSKVLSLSETAKPDDGKFEITTFYHYHRLKLITSLLKASTTGLKGSHKTKEFSFETLKPALVQLDGEISTIDARTKVTISLERTILHCIV